VEVSKPVGARRVKLTFPERLVKEPVLFTVAKQYDVMPNIRRAKVSAAAGEIVMELTGEEDDLDRALAHFDQAGILVEFLSDDVFAG
jgi:L-aspartate semialdehyde sulfurtransferase ferredoxin